MVSYDSYKNRIVKLAAVKNFIVKFRALFIILITLIIAASVTLLVMKGMVFGEIALPEQIVYGDSFSVDGASTFMSNVHYEYYSLDTREQSSAAAVRKNLADGAEGATDGGEWSLVKPDKAGRYLVRAVTERSFGTKGYSKAVEFEIQPKDIDFVITSTSVVYGNQPQYVFALINGDKLIATGLKYDYDSFETTVTNVCANSSSIKIIAPDGSDVTYCYNISTPQKQVTFVDRQITLTPESAQFIFDGNAVNYESVIDGNTQSLLSEGDNAVIQTIILDSDGNEVDAPVYVGLYTVKVTDYKIYKGDIDVTERYGVEPEDTTLEILRRPITISTASASREFNGEALYDESFETEGLPENSGHSVVSVSEVNNITFVGAMINSYDFIVTDGDGNDISDNYIINCNFGTLEVTPRKITVNTASAEKTYDGYLLSKTDGYEFLREEGTALVAGHKEELINFAQIYGVKQSGTQNQLLFAIFDDDGNDVSENYDITYSYGTLSIIPRMLTIATGTAEKEYDGYALSCDDAEIDGLADGEQAYISVGAYITDAGDRENSPEYAIYGNNGDTTENYDIVYTYGTLTVTPRNIIIKVYDAQFIYDGTQKSAINISTIYAVQSDDGFVAVEGKDGLVTFNHIPEITDYSTIVNVGEVKNTLTVAAIHEYRTNKDVTGNYNIVGYTNATLTVIKRVLTIYTQTNIDEEYDGAAHEYTGDWYGDNIAPDQTLIVDESRLQEISSVTDVQPEAIDNVAYYLVVDADGADVSANYDITYVWGKINLVPRTLTITTGTDSKVYDGTPLQCLDGSADRLVEGHGLELDESYRDVFSSVTYVTEGEVENFLAFKVTDGERDVSFNYAINYVWGTLCITQRPVTVTTGSATKVYDGIYFDGRELEPLIENLVEGERYFVFDLVGMLNVGIIENQTHYRFYVGENYYDGTDTTENYTITYVWGTLEITPRPLTITTGTAEKIYDDEPLYGTDAQQQTDNLVDGEYTVAIEVSEITDVGVIANATRYDIYSGEKRTTDNYDITYIEGRLTVTARSVTIYTADIQKEYDGEPLTGDSAPYRYVYIDGTDLRNDGYNTFVNVAMGQYCEPVTASSITDVGNVKNQTAFIICKLDENSNQTDVTYNYDLTYIYGTLTVTPREITVTTGTASHVYDRQPFVHTEGLTADRLLEGEPYGHILVPDSSQGDFASVTYVTEGGVENIVYVKVCDAEANDISANYNISYVWGTISIIPRPVTIYTVTDEKQYDGTPLYGNGAQPRYENLLSDEVLVVHYTDYITEVGEKPNETTYKIFYGELETTENYNISYVNGTLTVKPREITVTTGSSTHEYDRQPFTFAEYVNVENLLSGAPFNHRLALDESRRGEFSSVTYVTEGAVDNKVYFTVKDADGNDVSGNYTVNYVWGKISITKRALTVTTGSGEKQYDGNPLYGYMFEPEIENLVSGESFKHTDAAEITDVLLTDGGSIGSIPNQTHYAFFYGTLATTENYDIKYVYGTLSVTPRPITIQTDDESWVYDGKEHKSQSIGVIYTREDGSTEYGFVSESHQIFLSYIATLCDVGTAENSCEVYKIVEEDHRTSEQIFYKDISRNYKIVGYEFGQIEITPRPITIITPDKEWEYDGTEKSYIQEVKSEYYGNSRLFGLVEGHTVTVKAGYSTIVDAGTNDNIFEVDKIFDGDRDVSANYTVKSYRYGTLKVNPRKITVTTVTDSEIYNDAPFVFADYEKVERLLDGRPFNHALALDESRRSEFSCVTYVTEGEVDNKVYFTINDADGNDISGNYNINYVWGKISVTQRPVTITTCSNHKIFDGTPLKGSSVDPLVDNIVSGHEPVPDSVSSVTFVGSCTNETTYKIYDDDNNVTPNYNITYKFEGILEVKVCPLTITTGTKIDQEYDGTIFAYIEGWQADNLAEGHSLKQDVTKTPTIVTEVLDAPIDNVVYFIVVDSAEKDVSKNYEISYVWGKINRSPREITVSTASSRHEYDGQAFSYTSGLDTTGKKLVGGHKLVVDESKTVACLTDVGKIPNELYCKVLNSRNEDVSKNYSIIGYEYGELEVYKRKITVTTQSDKKDYDGTPLSNSNASADRIVEGHRLVCSSAIISITDAGSLPNEYIYRIYEGNTDLSYNYDISYVYGTLTVNKRKIAITLTVLPDLTYGDAFGGYPVGTQNYAAMTGSMADGELLEVKVIYTDAGGKAVSPKDAGTYNVIINVGDNASAVHYGTDYKQVTDTRNYQITQNNVSESKFTINKRDISIALVNADGTNSGGKVYDGQKFVYPDDGYVFTNGTSMAYGEKLHVAVNYYDGQGKAATEVKDADTYTINVNSPNSYIDGGDKVSKNYYLTWRVAPYTYKITPKPFDVVLEDDEYEYDGTVYRYPAAKVSVEGLLEGVTLNAVLNFYDKNGELVTAKYAATYTVEFDTENWGVSGDKKSNYKPNPVGDVTLVIKPRQIAVGVTFANSDTDDDKRLIVEYTGDAIGINERSYTSFKRSGEEVVAGKGFVVGDDLKYHPVYTFNGVAASPVNIGIYTVEINFADQFINANYNIAYSPATLEIVARKVAVSAAPIYGLEYDGGYFNESLLNYINYHVGNANEKGFLYGEEYEAEYTIMKGDKVFNPQTDILYAGNYTVSVELKGVDSSLYVLYYSDRTFTVLQRNICATPSSDDVVYSKTAYDVSNLAFTGNNVVRSGGGIGFVNDDIKYAAVRYMFVGSDGTEYDAPINAGTYSVYVYAITSNNASSFIETNYNFMQDKDRTGQLIIERITLIIAPAAQSKVFDGTSLELSSDGYKILNGASLMNGDILSVSGNAVLMPTVARVNVEIAGYSIIDATDGEDMGGNYNVIHSYDANNVLLADYKISSFRAALSYDKRTVKVEQIIPEYLKGQQLVYGGSAYFINYSGDGTELFNAYSYAQSGLNDVAESNYGLLEGHRLAVTSALLSNRPGVNTKWLKLTVYDRYGNNYSWGYNIIVEEKPESDITVLAIGLNVTVKADVSGMEDCVLDEDEFTCETYRGEILKDQFVQVSVVGGQITVTVQEVLNAGTENERYRDRTSYYEINCTVNVAQEAEQYDNF